MSQRILHHAKNYANETLLCYLTKDIHRRHFKQDDRWSDCNHIAIFYSAYMNIIGVHDSRFRIGRAHRVDRAVARARRPSAA